MDHLSRGTRSILYNESLEAVLQIGLALSCICVPSACALEGKNVAPPWAKDNSDGDAAEKGGNSSKQGKWARVLHLGIVF